MDNELLLTDRIAAIRAANEKYDLEHNAYISFSGGKDSTVLHYLMDLALPGNKIPRVFCNTGIEYRAIVKFVQSLAATDERFIMIQPRKNIKLMLEEVGYPFKSKEHGIRVELYQHGSTCKTLEKYLTAKRFNCPENLKYQFTPDFKLKVSSKCCHELKKKPFRVWEKQNKRRLAITGMQKQEGSQRKWLECIIVRNGRAERFHPLSVIRDEWEQWFIDKYNIQLCELYYPPFSFERTGCVGCPYNLKLEQDLATLKELLPAEYKQANIIWRPVYDEYKRIGYRLKGDVNGE